MKHDWEYKTLQDVCVDFVVPQRDKPTAFDGDIPWCRIEDIEGRFLNGSKTNQLVTKELADSMNMHICPKGTVICACSATIGKQAITTVDCYTNQTFIGIISDPRQLYNVYLYHFLNSQTEQLKKMGTGATIKYISKKKIESLTIPVPPLAIQEQIVAELDKVSEIIEKKKQQVKELDNLAQSIFYDMFGDPVENEKGWEVKKMNEVAPLSEYKGKHPSKDGQYWLLNLDKVESQTGRILDIEYFNFEDIGTSVISFDESNVLYSKLRPYLNKVVAPNGIGYATSELVPLKPNADLLNRIYLVYMLRSKMFVSFINVRVAGAKMPRVSMGTFRDFPVPVPPLSLQQSFAKKIEAIEKQKELINASIKEMQTLFDSRMEYYFG